MRSLRESDLPSLMRLVEAAVWNQTEADWLRLLELGPKLCLGVEREDAVVASATATPYGKDLAWIGMILTLPDFRGQGFAKKLIAELLERLDGIRTVKLDATSQGLPIYESFGFVEEGVVRRWKGRLNGGASVNPWNGPLDREAFGADRSHLLHLLGGSVREGRRAAYFGPIVAKSAAEVSIPTVQGDVYWDILESNRAAMELAASIGFEPFRRLVRMRRGPKLECREDWQFGIAGFELG